MQIQRLSRRTASSSPNGLVVTAPRRTRVVTRAAASSSTLGGWLSKERFADWVTISKELQQLQLKTVSAAQAQELAAKFQYLIVDVRPQAQYDSAHIPGSVHAPLFSLMDWEKQRGDLRAVLKYLVCTLNGVIPVFNNVNFAEDVQAAAKGYRGIIVACESGGTLEITANFPDGKVSRSLKAAHRILAADGNILDVKHMEQGVYGWHLAELAFDGEAEFDTSNIGRTPNAAYRGLMTDFKKGEGC